MDVYNGNEPYIFISYAHSDSKIVLPIIEHMQQAGIRLWYDAGIEAGTEWPQYIAEHLANASCILVFLSPNSANSHNCRNEINLASELKKEFLVVHLKDFDLPLGLKLQLNSNQAIYRSRFTTDSDFSDALVAAKILQKYRNELSVSTADCAPKVVTEKNKKIPKTLIIAFVGTALLAIILLAIIGFGGNKDPEPSAEDTPAYSTPETTARTESVIINYDPFFENLLVASETLECDSLWTPSTLIDNYCIDQGDGDVWTTYYTNAFQLENTSLHIGFRNSGAEIMAMLNSFKEQDLDKAYKIIECISTAVHGYYFTDFIDLMTNEDRDQWSDLGEARSIWNEVLELPEPAFLLFDENTEIETYYKKLLIDDLMIYVERRCRIYNGEKYFDFTILYEHTDNM